MATSVTVTSARHARHPPTAPHALPPVRSATGIDEIANQPESLPPCMCVGPGHQGPLESVRPGEGGGTVVSQFRLFASSSPLRRRRWSILERLMDGGPFPIGAASIPGSIPTLSMFAREGGELSRFLCLSLSRLQHIINQ
ncbi:uncharacterized protein BKA78DRAFT_313832 [Phyllosticta capitalensis]|uniref:uncharacterized protein n=1 Tax=Phyllosticta capitalensis TaxID=121624 RepID=UPI00312F0D65